MVINTSKKIIILLSIYSGIFLFETEFFNTLIRKNFYIIYNRYLEIYPQHVEYFSWASNNPGNIKTSLLISLIAALTLILLNFISLIYYDNFFWKTMNNKKSTDNKIWYIPFFSMVIFYSVYILFSFINDRELLYQPVDNLEAIVFSGIFTAIIVIYYSTIIPFNKKIHNINLYLNYLKEKNTRCLHMIHLAMWSSIIFLTGVAVTIYAQAQFKLPPEMVFSIENDEVTILFMIQLLTIGIGVFLGIIGQLYAYSGKLIQQIIQIDKISNEDE